MSIRRRAVAAFLTVVALTAGACAPLPAETEPRAIDRERVSDLFPAPTTTVPPSGTTGAACFVEQTGDEQDSGAGSRCTGVVLEDINARTLIDALAAGPEEKLREEGLTSFVPQDTRLLDAERAPDDSRILVINLSSEINSLSSPNNIVAYRQIVETITNDVNRLGVYAVRVKVDGKSTKIPTDRGQLATADPDDFNDAATGSASTDTGR